MSDGSHTTSLSSAALSHRASVRGSRTAPMGPRTRQSSSNLSPLMAESPKRNSCSPPHRMLPLSAGDDRPRSSSSNASFSSPSPLIDGSSRQDVEHLSASVDQPAPGYTPTSTAQSPTSPHSSPSRATSVSSAMNVIPEETSEDVPTNNTTSCTPIPSPTPSRIANKVTPTISLNPPPQITFESSPVQWKGLPLEAALWTFDSAELQNIVSRAIRSSAQESFIRLLSIDNLDHVLPEELNRLNTLKAVTQSKYRFNVQRRTMLLQALISLSGAGTDREKDGGTSLMASLAIQLAEVTASCDGLAEELVRVTDQVRQISKLIDVHWASALAVALRKLNGSYGKRTTELLGAHERIDHLQAELEDAWKEAERLAHEMDDLEAAELDFDPDEETGIIGEAQLVSLPSPPAAMMNLPPLSAIPSKLAYPEPPLQCSLPSSPAEDLHLHPIRSLTPPAPVASEALPKDDTDRLSVRSTKSGRSIRAQERQFDIVTAARRRSLRTSMGSLRLPRRLSTRTTKMPDDPDQPPVPKIPENYSPLSAQRLPGKDYSFLNFADSPSGSPQPAAQSMPHRMTLDDIEIVPRDPAEFRVGSTADDMYIMPLRDNEMDRTPSKKRLARRSADNVTLAGAGIMGSPRTGQGAIPSIWLNTDAPKTPAERVASLSETRVSAKGSSYGKLKSLTKRYSFPLNAMLARTLSTRSADSR